MASSYLTGQIELHEDEAITADSPSQHWEPVLVGKGAILFMD